MLFGLRGRECEAVWARLRARQRGSAAQAASPGAHGAPRLSDNVGQRLLAKPLVLLLQAHEAGLRRHSRVGRAPMRQTVCEGRVRGGRPRDANASEAWTRLSRVGSRANFFFWSSSSALRRMRAHQLGSIPDLDSPGAVAPCHRATPGTDQMHGKLHQSPPPPHAHTPTDTVVRPPRLRSRHTS